MWLLMRYILNSFIQLGVPHSVLCLVMEQRDVQTVKNNHQFGYNYCYCYNLHHCSGGPDTGSENHSCKGRGVCCNSTFQTRSLGVAKKL